MHNLRILSLLYGRIKCVNGMKSVATIPCFKIENVNIKITSPISPSFTN